MHLVLNMFIFTRTLVTYARTWLTKHASIWIQLIWHIFLAMRTMKKTTQAWKPLPTLIKEKEPLRYRVPKSSSTAERKNQWGSRGLQALPETGSWWDLSFFQFSLLQRHSTRNSCSTYENEVNLKTNQVMVTMVTMGGDLQPGCLADRLLTGLGQPQINP